MYVENIVRFTAGTFILLSLTLAYYVSWKFLYFNGFVGANLLQSAVTGFCPLEIILINSGFKRRDK
ncbi:MAG TPA: DUF2892 domain-containing protein [Candidatus Wallbacteria bacterium]|nr:DUF2892 domain-containing protein [Candidatus Wallbacteria bacterium]